MLNKNLDKMESVFDLVFTGESIKGLILLPYLVSFLLSSYLIVQKLGITKTVKIPTGQSSLIGWAFLMMWKIFTFSSCPPIH
jgi:hypothetical protein